MDPIALFRSLQELEIELAGKFNAYVCCLSTYGLDQYPNARMVSLKELAEDEFVITTSMNSRKIEELRRSPFASLTFWWQKTARQVRVQGSANEVDQPIADGYFRDRSREAQVLAWVSRPGHMLRDKNDLKKQREVVADFYREKEIPRPSHWGGIRISPIRIEFMEFNEDRMHDRTMYSRNEGEWAEQKIMP